MVETSGERSARVAAPPMGRNSGFQTFAIIVVGVAVLYFARDVFLPFAIAILLSFALQPIVSRLRRIGLPRQLAVITSVLFAVGLMVLFSAVIAVQLSDLARQIPTYQNNIITKIQSIKEMGTGNSSFERLSDVIDRLSHEIEQDDGESQVSSATPGAAANAPVAAPDATTAQKAGPAKDPLLVEIFSPQRPLQMLGEVVSPLIGPIATLGLVIVVVIFMLLDWEELRDRFIRLVGYRDLHKTTEVLQDAGQRVSQYLLMQLVVNVTYGVPIGVGLWLIGVPNALLWGMLTIVLRFVPYIGPFIAAAFPLFLAFAVAPGWSMLFWVVGLFLVVELVSNNVVEPWLYGSKTGLSALAIIVAAIFWTWLWGAVGLVLSTPLTVCLVVLGRHVPQFEFLQVLLGNEPVLDPKEKLYQRLLSGDPDEATDNAEGMLEKQYLIDFYGKVAIPALLMAEEDRARGVLSDEQMKRVANTASTLITNLQEISEEEAKRDESEDEPETRGSETAVSGTVPSIDLPDGEGLRILCLGGRSDLDDVSAAMFAQVLEVQGANVQVAPHTELTSVKLEKLALDAVETTVIAYLNPNSIGHGRLLVRRLKRARPNLRVGITLWAENEKTGEAEELANKINADFVTYKMTDAVIKALSEGPVVAVAPVKTMKRHRLAAQEGKSSRA